MDNLSNPKEKGLKPIQEVPSLQDLAYQAIKTSILSLAMSPGEHVSETELAEKLNVSKTPVREALQRLKRENLVRIVPRKGVFVTEISDREIEEISEIRSVLIGMAARRSVVLATEDDIRRARHILEAGDRALYQGDMEEWLQLNDQFHDWLLQVADNQSLRSILSTIDDYFHRFQYLAARVPGEIFESNTEHYTILEAIASRDPDVASQAAINHIINIGKQAILCCSNYKK